MKYKIILDNPEWEGDRSKSHLERVIIPYLRSMGLNPKLVTVDAMQAIEDKYTNAMKLLGFELVQNSEHHLDFEREGFNEQLERLSFDKDDSSLSTLCVYRQGGKLMYEASELFSADEDERIANAMSWYKDRAEEIVERIKEDRWD